MIVNFQGHIILQYHGGHHGCFRHGAHHRVAYYKCRRGSKFWTATNMIADDVMIGVFLFCFLSGGVNLRFAWVVGVQNFDPLPGSYLLTTIPDYFY